jgi:SAM-dependent methyltransferase
MPDTLDPATARSRATAPLAVAESRDFAVYQDYLRVTRTFMEGPLFADMRKSYDAAVTARGIAVPRTPDEAMPVVDDLLAFQIYCWAYRHLQRFKYHRPDLGIFDIVESDRARLAAALDAAAATAGDALRLDPGIAMPDYYRMIDFHQHTGGVWSDALDGLVYEIGRRTTTPSHLDPNAIYRMAYSQIPDGQYARVLDWGTGHGAGLREWQALHPESECHGVDISAPCLKLAHLRAREAGMRMVFSQQDLECLDYADDSFDLVFHLFMFHEIPPVNLKAMLKEVHRILKPGGLFAGPEFGITGEDAFVDVVRMSHAWTNNESLSVAWYRADIAKMARDAGFRRVQIGPFAPMQRKGADDGRDVWKHYLFEK